MKTTATITLLFLSTILLTSSCKKKDPEPEHPLIVQPTGNPASVAAMLSSLATPLQTYTMNAAGSGNFVCANGTKIFIYPNAFVTASGAAVSGIVTIEVKDILTKKDMILNNAFPVSNGQLLVSGGELYFNPTQNGQKLKISASSQIYSLFPATGLSPVQMGDFYAAGPSLLSEASLNWVAGPGTGGPPLVAPVQDTSGGTLNYYYSFASDSVGWTNCDYFYSATGPKTTCIVNLQGNFDNSNSMVFLSKNGSNVVARLNGSYGTISQQFRSYTNSIPVGENYTVGVIGYDGSNYYYMTQQVTMSANMVINLPEPVQTTKSQIEINLGGLP